MDAIPEAVEWSKRGVISRPFRARKDKAVIAAWRAYPYKIPHIFNVRSITSVRPPLTARLQTKPVTTTLGVVPHKRVTILSKNCLRMVKLKRPSMNRPKHSESIGGNEIPRRVAQLRSLSPKDVRWVFRRLVRKTLLLVDHTL